MDGAGLAVASGGARLRRARADGGEREGGEKGVRELPCYLAKLRGGELIEEERRKGGSEEAPSFRAPMAARAARVLCRDRGGSG